MNKAFDEVILNAAAIRDYQVCALLHDLRHRQNLSEPIVSRELLAQRYENTLKKILAFFFYKKQAGMTPSYNALVNRWEKLWFPKDMTAYDLALEQHETWHGNIASYSNAATISLMKFHEDFAEDAWEPLLIAEKFLVPLTASIRLEGTFDLVLRKGTNHRVIYISGRQKRPTIGSLALDFALLRHAFESRHDTVPPVKYALYDVGSNRPGFVAANPTKRDLDALYFWTTEAAATDVFAPRRGFTTYCRGCPFDEPCAAFRFPKIDR